MSLSKRGTNYIDDGNMHVCMCIQAISRFRLDWQDEGLWW